MVKKVIMNFDSSKVSGPDCILVLVLKNCEADLSYILAQLFNCVWKGSRTVVPEENRPPDNCLRTIAPWMIAPQTIVLKDNCPRGKLSPHHKVSPANNLPYSNTLPLKITTSELRKIIDCLRVL